MTLPGKFLKIKETFKFITVLFFFLKVSFLFDVTFPKVAAPAGVYFIFLQKSR